MLYNLKRATFYRVLYLQLTTSLIEINKNEIIQQKLKPRLF